ncbi:unnamed protein product [Durusdinium trenchii]|uniref:Uncharacterized protein n=2 Tax=Durusdinium trenchii TaxID=1381693 RepID=A0ABP0IGS9_9DINO
MVLVSFVILLLASPVLSFRADSQVNLTHTKESHKQTLLGVNGVLADAINGANALYRVALTAAVIPITGYAMMHDGECPPSVSIINVDGGFDYGLGCKFPDVCHCPKHPFNQCATASRFSDPDIRTKAFISTFGYCRTGTWVYVCSAIIILLLIGSIIYYVAKRRAQ